MFGIELFHSFYSPNRQSLSIMKMANHRNLEFYRTYIYRETKRYKTAMHTRKTASRPSEKV